MRGAGFKSVLMTKNLPLTSWLHLGLYVRNYTASELKEAVIIGEEYFWNNPEKPWRKPYYEKYVKKSFQEFIKEQVRVALSEKEKRIPRGSGELRDMQMQPDLFSRPSSQGRQARE